MIVDPSGKSPRNLLLTAAVTLDDLHLHLGTDSVDFPRLLSDYDVVTAGWVACLFFKAKGLILFRAMKFDRECKLSTVGDFKLKTKLSSSMLAISFFF